MYLKTIFEFPITLTDISESIVMLDKSASTCHKYDITVLKSMLRTIALAPIIYELIFNKPFEEEIIYSKPSNDVFDILGTSTNIFVPFLTLKIVC